MYYLDFIGNIYFIYLQTEKTIYKKCIHLHLKLINELKN